MRFISAAIRFNWQQLRRLRPRFTVRALMIVVALVAIVLGGHATIVELAARRFRIRRANEAIGIQIHLLRRASSVENDNERSEKERAARCRAAAEKAANESATTTATLWSETAEGAMRGAKFAATRAKTYQEHADALETQRSRTGGDLLALERLAEQSESWLATPFPNERELPQEVVPEMVTARAEHQARASGRARFPTVVGSRTSVIEATAIWHAERFIKMTQPSVTLKGCEVRATRLGPFHWTVTFIDPKTAKNYEVRTSFSEPSVTEYLAKNP